MKLLKTSLVPFMLVYALANTVQAVEPRDHQCTIDWSMRKEMFLLGSFQVKEDDGTLRGTFLVNYLPGANQTLEHAALHWKSAAHTLKPFLEGNKFWKNEIWGSFTHGLKWGWDANAECGIGAIPKDFSALWADFNSVSVSEFGGLGHKALDCLGVVASVVCRPIVGAGALVAGGLGSIVVPAFKLATKTCFGVGEAAICGAGWPVLKMLWNGTAWTATQVYSQTPAEENTIAVTWVPASKTCSVKSEL